MSLRDAEIVYATLARLVADGSGYAKISPADEDVDGDYHRITVDSEARINDEEMAVLLRHFPSLKSATEP